MKTPLRRFSLLLTLALALGSGGFLKGQEDQPSPPPAAETAPATPAAPAAPAVPVADEDETSESDAPSGLRRLDVEDSPAPVEDAAAVDAESSPAQPEQSAAPEEPAEPERAYTERGERFGLGENSELKADEQAEAVVSIFGSSTSEGRVRDSVVSVLGSSTASGDIRGEVVSILGNSRLLSGRVGGAVVSVLGNTYVNGRVGGEVVAVLGDVEFGPNAEVFGEVVCVGGRVKRDPAAILHGNVNHVAFGFTLGGFEWLQTWVRKCLLLGRPLAFGENLMWAWWLALGFLAFYVVLGLLFPRGIEKCARTFEDSPGYSILTALLVTLLTPLAAVVLVVTVLGTPALAIALLVGGLFGKAVMLAWIGRRITNHLSGPMAAPAAAVLVGGVIVLFLYTVPFLGFILMKLLAWLGIGVVAFTIIQMNRRPALTPAPAATGVSGVAATTVQTSPASGVAGAVPLVGTYPENVVRPVPPSESTIPSNVPPPVSPLHAQVPVVVSAATMPRAGFWIRIGASLLDLLIVGIAVNLMPDFWQPNLLLIYATYCCVMWGFKGTTVGGVVCGLKVVRLDDRQVDWATAIVRTLGGFLSLAAAGVGFIWVAFDDQKQSWHDKIAGTTIVHVPRGVSLV